MHKTVDFVDASLYFEACELDSVDQSDFLDGYTYGGDDTAYTLIERYKFYQSLRNFILDLDDSEIKLPLLEEFRLTVDTRIKYVNIEG